MLDRTLELKRRYVACFEPYDELYDPLLDDFEPGLKTPEVREVFDTLKGALVPLIAEVGPGRRGRLHARAVPGRAAARDVASHHRALRLHAERVPPRQHRPSVRGDLGTQDIRLTSRYSENDLTSLFTAMHECGHGIFEHGVSATLERTPLCHGVSSALHESQSRLWENVVGRSRASGSSSTRSSQKTFPDVLGGVELERFYRAVNRVRPSYIRVDSDEATYSLHIILRFELEQELLSGSLSTADLPDAWNERFREYLGIDVPEDRLGVLQDVHWSAGCSATSRRTRSATSSACRSGSASGAELPDLDEQFARGEFDPLHDWLREHVYRHGRKFTPQELLERVVGGGIDAAPYVRYLREKFGALATA